LPLPTLAHQQHWRSLAGWLLAKHATFRKAVNAANGFPAKGSGAGAAARSASNDAMRSLLAELAGQPGLAAAVDVARRLPPPRYSDEAWAIAAALLAILPQVAAHLMLTFRANSAVDFVQGTIAALDALGTADEPTDLLLRLDFQLLHLLVDEFQDTSYTQLELIRRLTAGWQRGDGRTLFAVGDPMQSVYRFREAEVRLFVEAQARKLIGEIPVECLTLRCNFRAQAKLVEWVNAVFPHVLGARSDPWRSVVAFAEATPMKPALGGSAASIEAFADASAESAAVVEHIRTSLSAGAKDIAVLVRARAHLDAVLPALRSAQIPFAAVDLDVLAQRQPVQDLLSLTHALAQPTDRLAWLSVLRAPWCGITLPDLFVVLAAADQLGKSSLAPALEIIDSISGLSDDGRRRLERIARALVPALASRGCTTLERRVRGAWLALGGPACAEDVVDLNAAERFFALLADHEIAGDIAEWSAFLAALTTLPAEPDVAAGSCVQVMTLHRAKGLEFDTVIVPGTRANAQPRHESIVALAPATAWTAAGADEQARWRRRSHLPLSLRSCFR
jgi:ATP-dependent exoDNAse (exonuclease V) beta subunit